MAKTYISTFTYNGQDIEVLYTKGQMSYVFEYKGERYGGAIKREGTTIRDTINATMCLLINYLETREAVDKKHGQK